MKLSGACLLVLVTACAQGACGDDASTSTPSEPRSVYNAALTTSMDPALPDRKLDLVLTITDEAGAAAPGLAVAVAAGLGGTSFDLGAFIDDGNGVYRRPDLQFNTGTWTFTVTMTGEAGVVTQAIPVTFTCDGGGAAGAACCSADVCDDGMMCVAGGCSATGNEPGGDCWTAADCTGGVCTDGTCAAPACDDGILNGTETGVDCAGGCALCGFGQPCGGPQDCASGECVAGECAGGLPVLGGGAHTMDGVAVTVLASNAEGLGTPRDLAVNPNAPNQLWVVNNLSESVTVLFDFGTPAQTWKRYSAGGSAHFLARPSSLAFSDNGNLASIHETDDLTQGPEALGGSPRDFMGPTLWPADLQFFNGGHSSHLDMLHNSPNGVGIEAEGGNAFWVFDGYHQSLTRYDFRSDHGMGGADHSDGIVARYAEGEVSYVPETNSHMVFLKNERTLLVADSGNNRIAALDVDSGTRGSNIAPNYDGVQQYRMDGATLTTYIDGSKNELLMPSGLAAHDGILYVGDAMNGRITAFDMTTRERIDWLDTGLGQGELGGLEVDASGNLYYAAPKAHQVVRVAPR